MNVIPTAVTPTPDSAGIATGTVRILAGNLAAVPVGELLKATVTQVRGGEATLSVNGQPLTVRPPGGLQAGGEFVVRIPAGSQNPTLEVLGKLPANSGLPSATGQIPVNANKLSSDRPGRVSTGQNVPVSPQGVAQSVTGGPVATSPPRMATVPAPAPMTAGTPIPVADVISATPDGRVVARIDGKEVTATTAEPLAPGGRFLVRVESTPAGIVLRSPPAHTAEPTAVATSILRTARPADLGAAVKPLLAEIATPTQPAIRTAAAEVRDAVRSFLPETPRPLNAPEMKAFVENGGLHYEAKLGRAAEAAATSDTPSSPADAPKPADLKGGLLHLLQAARTLGEPASAYPVSQAVLDGIEFRQAANVVAQQTETPYFLQVPFPDGDTCKTANLSLEPDRHPSDAEAESARGFRMMMHVPLTDLGDTWIDAGAAGGTFRAVIYLDSSPARDRVKAELDGLRDELLASGFGEVLLDVRAGSELPERHRSQSAATRAGRPVTVNALDVRA